MEGCLESLQKARRQMLTANIAYFLALLAAGLLILYLTDERLRYLGIAVCISVYLTVVRPLGKRYRLSIREAVLKNIFGKKLKDYTYEPGRGIQKRQVADTDLFPMKSDKAFLSRELVCGSSGNCSVEIADVAFPICIDRQNEMFNGCFIQVEFQKTIHSSVCIKAGNVEEEREITYRTDKFLKKLASEYGNIYLRVQENKLTMLCRGKFLGFRINPLYPVTSELFLFDPLPEFKKAMDLVQLMSNASEIERDAS
ncbi:MULTISPECIES: hypothetical protein [Acutalibacteraceae]|uniref:hypothetical protein n=1 Tax=Acutalibacteraceae TaxID=3082771 RepID=UPI00196AAEE5|nr:MULTISPECIES: hypothetical protein [Acutalibacteraceae]